MEIRLCLESMFCLNLTIQSNSLTQVSKRKLRRNLPVWALYKMYKPVNPTPLTQFSTRFYLLFLTELSHKSFLESDKLSKLFDSLCFDCNKYMF